MDDESSRNRAFLTYRIENTRKTENVRAKVLN